MDTLRDLLLREAISNYVVAIVTILSGIIGWILATIIRKRKPSIIKIEKWIEGSTIHMNEEIQEKTQITYDGQQVDNIYHSFLRIVNTGDTPIENIRLYIALDGLTPEDFLEVILTSREEIQKITHNPIGTDCETYTLDIPFLNPWKEHKGRVDVEFYAAKSITIRDVAGSGLGWSTRYTDKSRYADKLIALVTRGAEGVTRIIARLIYLLTK